MLVLYKNDIIFQCMTAMKWNYEYHFIIRLGFSMIIKIIIN